MLRRAILIFTVATIVVTALIAATIYYAATSWRSQGVREVEIAQGMPVRGIAGELAKNGVIGMPRLFEIVARIKGAGGKLKSGTYEFPEGTTLLAALGKIERGEVKQYPFTIIEGWRTEEIATALEKQPFVSSPDFSRRFLALCTDRAFIASLGFDGRPSLEGYLFPDTYLISRPVTPDALIKRLVARFKEVWGSLDAQAIQSSPLSPDKLVTLASIVEKETGAKDERPIIASVFFNRLKAGMPLQSDPTIIYGLTDYDGNIRKGDITNPHPYNTYVHAGLPPGPISNPGKASLEAVIHPAQTNYLYFVSKNDGTHFFSDSLAEHSQAVRLYQVQGEGKNQ